MARYCLECGHVLGTREIEGRVLEACPACGFVRWPDPKLVTITLAETPRGLVFGRRGIEPGYGLWCLPGGFVNDDEHPADAAARECLEEVCAEVDVTGLVGVFHIRKQDAASMVGIAYRAELRPGAEPSAGEEMLEVATFAPEDLPELAFPSHREAVLEWRRSRESSLSRESR